MFYNNRYNSGFSKWKWWGFQFTLDLVNKCKFDGAYTFIIFLLEFGTPASLIEDLCFVEERRKIEWFK